MIGACARNAQLVLLLGAVLVLTGCSSRQVKPAPVEDRSTGATAAPPAVAPVDPAAATVAASSRPPAGVENAGKTGYYTVRPGDTLIRIGLDNGQSWRDIARWNSLENPNLIEVGQVLRVVPPAVPAAATAVVSRPVVTASVTATPVAPAAAASAAAATRVAPTPAASPGATPTPTPATATATAGDDELTWAWPARGAVLTGFDEVRNKGLDIAGTSGEPVLAAADGRVVYVGSSLRGYGNLVILKHNNTYLTAYAHNQALLVKEDQTVRRGQKIAEMGSSDADRVKLHFEVRRQGKPVDPAKYMPPR